MSRRALFRLLVLLLLATASAACGAHRMTPVDVRGTATLMPDVEDADGGNVGMAPGFTPKGYEAIVIEPFTVAPGEIKDEDDIRLAKDMSAYLHAQLVNKLQASKIFARVIDASTSPPATGPRFLRLQGDITRLTEGSQAMRYFVGFGAGAAKAQIETRLIEQPSGQVQLVTADRRAAGMGIFGGDGRQFVTESMDQMADGLVKLLARLVSGGRPGKP
jgi:hypothetical protein